jgi:hypothetical protein
MSITSVTKPDLSELNARQRRAWAAGDYSMVASRTDMVSKRRPHEPGDLRALWRERARDSRAAARC